VNFAVSARWIPRFIGLAVVVSALTFLWIRKPWQKREDGVTFSTVPVGRGTISAQVTANGTLSARTTVQVGAQVSGRVVELKADFNDPVKKGQVLARLDDSVLKAQIDQAQAAYDLAVANANKAAVALVDADRRVAAEGSEPGQLSYADEELVVETVACLVCATLGLDVSAASIPYLADWASQSKVETIEAQAKTIDALARRLEDALIDADGQPLDPESLCVDCGGVLDDDHVARCAAGAATDVRAAVAA